MVDIPDSGDTTEAGRSQSGSEPAAVRPARPADFRGQYQNRFFRLWSRDSRAYVAWFSLGGLIPYPDSFRPLDCFQSRENSGQRPSVNPEGQTRAPDGGGWGAERTGRQGVDAIRSLCRCLPTVALETARSPLGHARHAGMEFCRRRWGQ